jgi:hypothetical protein
VAGGTTGRCLAAGVVWWIDRVSFCEGFQLCVQNLDIDLGADSGGACFGEAHFSLKQFMLKLGEFIEVQDGAR